MEKTVLNLGDVVASYDPSVVSPEKLRKESRAGLAACGVCGLLLVALLFAAAVIGERSGLAGEKGFSVSLILVLIAVALGGILLSVAASVTAGSYAAYGKKKPACADVFSVLFQAEAVKVSKVGEKWKAVWHWKTGDPKVETLSVFLHRTNAPDDQKAAAYQVYKDNPEGTVTLYITHDADGETEISAKAETVFALEYKPEAEPKTREEEKEELLKLLGRAKPKADPFAGLVCPVLKVTKEQLVIGGEPNSALIKALSDLQSDGKARLVLECGDDERERILEVCRAEGLEFGGAK